MTGISSNVLDMCHGMDYCSNQYRAISNQGKHYPLVCSYTFSQSTPTASHGFAAAQLQFNCMAPAEWHPRSAHATWWHSEQREKANTVKTAAHTGRESRPCENIHANMVVTHVLVYSSLGSLCGSQMPTLPHQLIWRHTGMLLVSYLRRKNKPEGKKNKHQ